MRKLSILILALLFVFVLAVPIMAENAAGEDDHVHKYENGVCSCGKNCDHTDTEIKTVKAEICKDCGNIVILSETDDEKTGSALSDGSLAVIVGIAAFVMGLGIMFLIMKKPDTVSGQDNGDNEAE